MRNQLLCALAFLCGSAFVNAQGPPANDYNGLTGKNAFVPVGGTASNGSYQPGYNNAPAQYNYGNYAQNNLYPSANPQMVNAASLTPTSPLLVSHDVPAAGDPGMDELHGAVKGADAGKEPCKERFWVTADYTFSWIRAEHVNTPLVTTGAQADLHPGALGQPGTTVLFGDPLSFGMASGLHADAGVFLDDHQVLSLDWNGLFIFPTHVRYRKESDESGNPIIARPVFNVVANREAAFVDSLPGFSSGSVAVDAKSSLFGTEANMRLNGALSDRWHADGLFGFRFLHLSESLTMDDEIRPLVSNGLSFDGQFVNPPNMLTDEDRFQTTNNFYGLQLGGRLVYDGDWITFSTFGKIAFGPNDQTVNINGSTTLLTPNGSQTAAGGILALPSNIGGYNRTVLAFVPEGGVNLGVNVTQHVQLIAGYSLLFFSQVVRPGAQIDRFINTSQVPSDSTFGQSTPPTRPIFNFNEENYWVHSLSLGLAVHY